MKIKHQILAVLCCCFLQVSGQDFHNSFIQFAPMTLNPALTGAFYGNLRANVIGRDQGRGTAGAGNEWQDLSLGADYNFDWGLTKDDWVSAGLNLSRSTSAGIGDRALSFNGISAAYHYAFGKKSDKVLTVGLRYGTYGIKYRSPNADYKDPFLLATGSANSADIEQWRNSQFSDPNNPGIETSDYMLGFMLDTPMSKTSDIRIGIAVDHLLAPRLATMRDPNNPDTTMVTGTLANGRLDRRVNAFVFYYTDISDRLTFNPNILVQHKGVSTNILTQLLFNYVASHEKQMAFIFGLGARFSNNFDIPIYLAMDLKDWRFGISYDTNVNGLRATNNTAGALELGITRIFNWNKKAVVQPVFICPRL